MMNLILIIKDRKEYGKENKEQVYDMSLSDHLNAHSVKKQKEDEFHYFNCDL